jgi:predicted alpha/beta superfamily hydrolase
MKEKIALTILSLFFNLLYLESYGQSVDIQIEKDSIVSKSLGYVMDFYVYVPENYIPQQNKKFNVVYVLDGNPDSKLLNLVIANFDYTNNDLYLNFPPFIIVGIDTQNRSQEFTPKTNDEKTLNNYLFKTYGYGRADDYISFLQNELFPHIKREFDVTDHRLGVGHSLGGTLLMYSLNTNPSLFNAYFLFSPNLEYGNKQLVNSFARTGSTSAINKFLYVSVGDDSNYEQKFRPGIDKLDSVVNSNQYHNFFFHLDHLTNCSHFESPQIALPLAITDYKNLYRFPSIKEREEFLLSKTGYLTEIKKFYEVKANTLGYLYEPSIDVINNELVYFALDRNKNDYALDVVNWGIELYPDNYFTPSLYLTKSYVLEAKQDIQLAIRSCEEGLIILNNNKAEMNQEDYSYAREDLMVRIEGLANNYNR